MFEEGGYHDLGFTDLLFVSVLLFVELGHEVIDFFLLLVEHLVLLHLFVLLGGTAWIAIEVVVNFLDGAVVGVDHLPDLGVLLLQLL